MGQHQIGVVSHVFELLHKTKMKLANRGRHYSMTMLLEYLVEFERIVTDDAFRIAMLADKEEAAKEWELLVNRALDNSPRPRPRGTYKRSTNADVMKRLDVIQQMKDRLGILEPPSHLVDWFLDNVNDDVFRKLVAAKNSGDPLRWPGASDTGEAP